MKTLTQSILLTAMLSASGFVAAQTAVLPPDGTQPSTRAEVKSQINQDATSGNIRADGPQIKNPAAGKSSENSRADVKAQINTRDAAVNTQAQGSIVKSPPTGNSEKSREDVKAEIGNKAIPRVVQAQGPSAESNVTMTTAERKARRDERRAMAKAKRDAKMNSTAAGTSPPATQKAP